MMREPAPGQQQLRPDRGQRMQLLRRVRLGSVARKAMLLLLDHHIGSGESWAMTLGELAHELEVSIGHARRIIRELDALAVIRRQSADRDRVRFSICWRVLDDLDQEQRTSAAAVEMVNTTSAGARELVETASAGARQASAGAHETSAGARWRAPAHRTSYEKTREPPSPPNGADRMAAMVAVQEAGVGEFVTAVETATAQGMTPSQILAVVDYFRSQPGRWSAGVLYHRLTKPGAAAEAPHEGWFGDRPGYRPPVTAKPVAQAPDRRAEVAAHLDAMTDADLLELASRDSPANEDFLRSSIDGRRLTGQWHPEALRDFARLLKPQTVEA